MSERVKEFGAAIALLVILAVCAVATRHVYAQSTDLPSKMDVLDVAQLDAALAHFNAIQTQAQVAQQPYALRIKEISDRYHINLEPGHDNVDLATGIIKRAPKGASK